jgi:PPOX class probable F420-dependent enzyme
MTTSMTAADLLEFLATQRTLVLATTKRDGAPVMHPVWFVHFDDAIYINVQTRSIKYRNVERDDRVCCLVESGESYFELRGVMIQGRARRVDDPTEIARVEGAVAEKAARIGGGVDELPAYFFESRRRALARQARAILRISVDRVYSWDFGKTRGHYSS